jgi:general secretion pathway protein M
MTAVISAWKGRIAALLILIALFGSAYLLLVAPLLVEFDETRQAVADARDLLTRFNRLGVVEAGLRRQMAELEHRQSSTGLYLTYGSDALAAVEIQDRVKGVVQENGGAVRSVQAMSGQTEGEFRRVTVRLQMAATMGPLYRTLYRLEAEKPVLFVDNIGIQSQSLGKGDGNATDPILTVNLDVFGYLSREGR